MNKFCLNANGETCIFVQLICSHRFRSSLYNHQLDESMPETPLLTPKRTTPGSGILSGVHQIRITVLRQGILYTISYKADRL